ncbi:MAG: AsmA-like C-terminal domain-containing protein [Alphaproteobacteria bacterium]
MLKRIFRFVIGFVAATVAAIAFGVMWLAFEVSSGPVRLGPLTPILADQLSRGLKPYDLQIENAEIIWDTTQREIDLTLNALSVQDDAGQTVLSLPRASLGFDLTEAIAGRVAPTYLIVPDASLRVIRDREGRFATGFAGVEVDTAPDQDSDGDPLAGLLGPLGGGGVAGWLRRIDLERAVVTYEDQLNGKTLKTRSTTIRLQRAVDGTINLAADTVIETAEGAAWPISAQVSRATGADNLTANLNVSGASLAVLATHIPELSFMEVVDMPLEGQVVMELDRNGLPTFAGIAAQLGAGQMVLPDFYDKPLKVDRARIAVEVDVAAQKVEIQTLLINRGPFRFGFKGAVHNDSAGIGVKGFGGFEGLNIDTLKQLWPRGAAEGARTWVQQNMLGGDISNARLRLDIPPGALEGRVPLAADAIDLTFDLSQTEAFYVRSMPPMREGQAKAHLTGQKFTIKIDSANIDTLKISDARFTIPDLAAKPTLGDAELVLRGSVADILWLIDHEPLGYPTKLGLLPESFSGRGAARVRISLPLVKDLLMDDLSLGVAAKVEGVDLPPLVNGFDLTDADMTLSVTGQGLHGQGTINVNGIEVAAQWQERFTEQPEAKTPPSLFQGHVITSMADRSALLKNLNVDFSPYLNGSVPLDVSIGLRGGKLAFIDLDMQLAQASLSIPQLAHEFGVGAALQGQARLRLPEVGGMVIEGFELEGEGLSARADLTLNDKYQISQLVLEAKQLPELAQNIVLTIKPDVEGSQISLIGQAAWLNGLGEGEEGSEQEEEGDGLLIAPLALNAELSTFTLFKKLVLNEFSAALKIDDGDLIQQLDMSGSHAGSAKPVKARMAERGASLASVREVRILSEDAGAFMPLTGIVDQAEGGTLAAQIYLSDDDKPISGEIVVRDVRLKKAPPVVSVLNFGSFVGIADSFADRGMLFTNITAPFTMHEGEITLRNAVAVGPSLGVHSSGVVDLGQDRLNLAGTITPAYSLNSFLGLIPGIGEMIVGGEGQGLFAARFEVSGEFSEPKVSVNALSALTPGFLRNLFVPEKDPVSEAPSGNKAAKPNE